MAEKYPIRSEVVGLEEILNKKYNIPVYQRPYEWNEKNIDDFLSSIFDGFREKNDSKLERKPIFFGTIQLNKENKNNEIEDIVDGQQRLTTFILFMDVLQINYCNDKNSYEDYSSIIESKDLKEALTKDITEIELDNYISRYLINKRLLNDKTNTYYKEFEQKEFFNTIKEFVLKNVYFVRLITEEMELSDVVSVFNTINTTGLDLNATDIFKFRYYDYLRKVDNSAEWMEKINECYRLIEQSNEKCNQNNRTDQSMLDMSWVLDIYKHIICAKFGWGYSEVSKSNQKFFDDLFKEKKYQDQDEKMNSVLDFSTFKRIVEEFISYWRWIEEVLYQGNKSDFSMELLSIRLIEKTRYSRYWTIPFINAFFKSNGDKWDKYYEDSLRINLYMFRFFTVYTVINDKVINAVHDKVCKACFNWFQNCNTDETIINIKELMWSSIRWEGHNPKEAFYNIIRTELFYNGSRAHLICTLSALLDEIEYCGKSRSGLSNSDIITLRNIRERLFNWVKNPYDIEHIVARNIFDKYDEKKNKNIYNGIGNLVVLDRSINRNIKDIPVIEKKKYYKDSKYVSVSKILIENIQKNDEWDDIAVENRQKEEIHKLELFMEA